MKKRVLSVLLCVAMTAAMIVGCGNKASEEAPAEEKKAEETMEEDKEEEMEEEKEEPMMEDVATQAGVVTNMVDMTQYAAGEVVRVWLPIPQDNEYQTITDVKYDMGEEMTDAEGNKMLYIEWPADADPATRKASLSFHAERKAIVRPELKEEGEVDTTDKELADALKGSSMVNIDDQGVKDLAAQITDGKDTVLAKAEAIYDWIYENMNRDNDVKGCGDGDICRLLADGVRAGKCTDINSVFVGLCRASGIPAREMFGIRINADDITKNQHCWAEFYLPGTGWVAADPADVLKFVLNADGEPYAKDSAEALEKKDFYWGNNDEKRIELSQGRDLTLAPAQADGTLNDFGYPYAEVNDKAVDYYVPDAFVYTYSFVQD